MSTSRRILILGGAGFVGRATIAAAITAGYEVLALVRSPSSAIAVSSLGARPVRGDAGYPDQWISSVSGVEAVIDLTQPALPARLTRRTVARIAQNRRANTNAAVLAVTRLPRRQRPRWIFVSGTDDLLPDKKGRLSSASPLRVEARGFGRIGLPVRHAIEASGIDAVFVYFGQMVYGPGKTYESVVVNGVRTGKARIIGSGQNNLPLTHLEDAAGAVTHLLSLDSADLLGRTVVATPSTPSTQQDLYALTAAALDRPAPRHAPAKLAALIAGQVTAEVMTADALCEPDILVSAGYRFRHNSPVTGIPATLAALGHTSSSPEA